MNIFGEKFSKKFNIERKTKAEIKNSVDGLKSKMEKTEKCFSKLEDRNYQI